MKLLPELKRQILEDVLGTSYEAYVNFKREPTLPKKRQHRRRIPLWRFILHLLNRDRLSQLVQWIDLDQYKFKIKEPNEVAQLWGSIKDKADMTYEKLGRAMRYYYGKNIIEKVTGMRYSYRFIVSRKTSKYLDRLVMRRGSIDSAASLETSTESGSVSSEECDSNVHENFSSSGSPSSFMNDNFECYLSPTYVDMKMEDDFNSDDIQKEFFAREAIDEPIFTPAIDDSFWTFQQETFIDLEDVKLVKKEPVITCSRTALDERLLCSGEFPQAMDVFLTGNY